MGLLDELQQQARDLERRRDLAAAKSRADTALAEEKLRPRMRAAYRYFNVLMESLRVIAPEVRSRCQLPGFGETGDLESVDYKIWQNAPDDPTVFSFGYDCVSSTRHECRLKDKVAENVRKTLENEKIRCTVRSSGAGLSRLILEPRIPVRFELRADRVQGVVRLRVRNLDRLGSVEYTYPPEAFTEELMEELGKRMLGKPNRFKEMSGGVVDTTRRDALQSEIARDRRRRDAELGGPVAKLWWRIGELVRGPGRAR